MTELETKKSQVMFTGVDRNEIKSGTAENSDNTTSDASSSSMKSSDGYLPTNEPTSNSSSDSDIIFSSDDDSEDVEETIDFIRQKQGILKRAASVLFDHEETYDAATARTTSRMAEAETKPGNIWAQAKRVVPQKKTSPRRVNMRRSTGGPNRGERKTVKPNPRHPNIQLGEVAQVASSKFDNSAPSEEDESSDGAVDGLPEVAFPQSQWMAKALIRSSSTFSISSTSNPNDCLWKVVSDPLTCSLGLVPPSSVSMEHGIAIEEALAFSDEGRLLTQATPPFCVVYVNKAFMVLAGLTSKETLIGKPVESFLQVTQDIMKSPKSNPDDDFIRALLLRSQFAPMIPEDNGYDEDSIRCRMMVVPVMDRARRRRLSPHSRQSKRFSCMSHVLIRIRESDEAVSPSSSSMDLHQEDPLAVSESDTRKDEDAYSSSSSGEESIRSNMVETVG